MKKTFFLILALSLFLVSCGTPQEKANKACIKTADGNTKLIEDINAIGTLSGSIDTFHSPFFNECVNSYVYTIPSVDAE